MPLKLFHCEGCESEFRISPKLVGRSDDLTCPVCGQETVAEGPVPDPDEEDGEVDVEGDGGEDEEPPRRQGRSSRRTSRGL